MRRQRIRYGPARAQVGELSLPEDSERPPPVVVVMHGGYWRGIYSYRLVRPIARAFTDAGFAAWNIEYRRVGLFGGGGGWPETFLDVAAAIDFLGSLTSVDATRVATCGHSAGGHLALWAAGRHRLPVGAPGYAEEQRLRAAVALAGVSDLENLDAFGLGSDAVDRLLGGTKGIYPDRFRQTSPAALLPCGIPQLLVHGLEDTTVPPKMSETYVALACELGDDATYLGLPDVNHRQMIEVWHHALEPVVAYLEPLLN